MPDKDVLRTLKCPSTYYLEPMYTAARYIYCLFHSSSWFTRVQQYPHETHEMAVDYPTVTEPSVVKTFFSVQAAHMNHVQTHCIIGGTPYFVVRRAV